MAIYGVLGGLPTLEQPLVVVPDGVSPGKGVLEGSRDLAGVSYASRSSGRLLLRIARASRLSWEVHSVRILV